MAALMNNQPDTRARATGSRGNREWILSPPVSPIFQSSASNTEPKSLPGLKTITLPIIRPPVPIVNSLSNTMSVLALIDLQYFDGSWDANSETLSPILRVEILKPRSSLLIDADAWVTMLVFRFLEDIIPEEKNVWCLVVEKARRHLHLREWLRLLFSLLEMFLVLSLLIIRKRQNWKHSRISFGLQVPSEILNHSHYSGLTSSTLSTTTITVTAPSTTITPSPTTGIVVVTPTIVCDYSDEDWGWTFKLTDIVGSDETT
ncbi:hypothetical protein EAE96_007378 [Botrytis aclada]|nr:hypothetical protein EAE96_007378 [Botrytis aclada]